VVTPNIVSRSPAARARIAPAARLARRGEPRLHHPGHRLRAVRQDLARDRIEPCTSVTEYIIMMSAGPT
jgi:hypothetical protein